MEATLSRRTLGGTALVLAVLLGLQALPRGAGTQRATDLFQLCLAVAATVAAARACRRAIGAPRFYWSLIAASTAAWALGQSLFTLEMTAFAATAGSQLQRVMFQIAPWPLAAAALVRPDRPPARPALGILDVSLVAVLGLFVNFYVGAAWSPFAPETPVWREFVTLGQLLAAAVTLVPAYAASGLAWRGTYRRVATAALVWFGGNALVAFPLYFVPGWYRPGLLDIPWTVPFLWLAVTAWEWHQPPAPDLTAPWEPWRDSRRELVLALGAVTSIAALPLAMSLAGRMDDGVWRARSVITMAALISLVGLLAVRQMIVVRDAEVRARLRAQDLERSDAMFQGAFARSPAAMALVRTGDLSVVDVNARCAELLGRPPEALVGMSAVEAMSPSGGQGQDGLERLLRQVAPVRNHPLRLHRPAGPAVDSLASIEQVEVAGEPCSLLLLEDVGERRLLEEQLAQLQRVDAIGRLAGGIAHEFNNQLTAIIAAASLAQAAADDRDAVEGYLEHVDRASDRAVFLTRQLLAFGRRQALRPEVLDVAEVVEEVCALLRPVLSETIHLEASARPGRLWVRADRTQLKQVLLSLAANARDAMPKGGRLSIVASVEPEVHPAAPGRAGHRDVAVTVSDNGVGMSDAVQEHLFEPFFTTKDRGTHEGLGLATAYGIVAQSEGRLVVESAPGQGTTVRVILPEASGGRADSGETDG